MLHREFPLLKPVGDFFAQKGEVRMQLLSLLSLSEFNHTLLMHSEQ